MSNPSLYEIEGSGAPFAVPFYEQHVQWVYPDFAQKMICSSYGSENSKTAIIRGACQNVKAVP